MRLKALHNFDQLLEWSTSERLKTYALVEPIQEELFHVDIPEIENFAEDYGYFSLTRPLIGKVSKNSTDVKFVACILKALYEAETDNAYLEFATAEVLTKALAYRDLKEGQKIQLPVVINETIFLETYVVEQIFNLWNGMPAFGLVAKRANLPSILLFRGTDFSLDSRRGWASLMSDLDIAGPGITAFQNAKDEIHHWLKEMSDEGKNAKVMGYSLGGSLAINAFIYENEWLAEYGSVSFCPPGVTDKVFNDWSELPLKRQRNLTIYVNEGDLVSKSGKLLGIVYALSTGKQLKPLSAHTELVSGEPFFLKSRVDIQKENEDR